MVKKVNTGGGRDIRLVSIVGPFSQYRNYTGLFNNNERELFAVKLDLKV